MNNNVKYQHQNGHAGLYVCNAGFHISESYPFLGVSPDGSVYDPTEQHSFGFLEIKCTYKYRNITPLEAASKRGLLLPVRCR